MKVIKEIVLEVPGLGQRIRNARVLDRRPLKEIADAAKMTNANWYRIEAEAQSVSEEVLRRIESALGVDFGVKFDD